MDSIVDFPTLTRPHIGLGVRDVDAAVAFYKILFGADPVKEKEGYAKFETDSPPLNLSLNRSSEASPSRGADHFGIQVKTRAEVVAAHGRLKAAGFATMDEEGVTCCFSVQDKIWAIDPDGHRWEIFVVLADADVHSLPGTKPVAAGEPGEQGEQKSADPADSPRCCG